MRNRAVRRIANRIGVGLTAACLLATIGMPAAVAMPLHGAIPRHLPAEVEGGPVQSAVPIITGDPVVGGVLTLDKGQWEEGAALAVEWLADGEVIEGETGDELTLGASLHGKRISVRVTGTKDGRTPVSEVSEQTLRVAQLERPWISGQAVVGGVLTAEVAAVPGASLSYQWSAGIEPIAGANEATLVVPEGAEGRQITVRITQSHPEYAQVSNTSADTLQVLRAGTPTISGTAAIGRSLQASLGSWSAGTSFSYRWLADGVPIAGATASNLTVGSTQADRAITVEVTGSKPGHPTVARVSGATLTVMRRATPVITGYAYVGSTVKADPGTWSGAATLSYQWFADGKVITGATGSTLKLSKTVSAKKLTVRVTGAGAGYQGVAMTSSPTGKVTVAGSPGISGSAVVGSTLTAKPGTWTAKTTFGYQWFRDGKAIKGATKARFKIGGSQKDGRLTVTITGKKSGYATVVRESKATAKVQTAPTPRISGTVKVTSTLRVTPGAWSSGTTFRYQWYANGKAIKGASKSKLKLSSKDAGKRITVKLTGRKSGYPTVSRTSKATGKVTYPNRTEPVSLWNCPSWAPIKGNADSGIYHVPSGAFYDRTIPEECFRTESAARAAGYRKSKR